MANDIDMWNDIEDLERSKSKKSKQNAKILMNAYKYKFIEPNSTKAEYWKNKCKNAGIWGNYW